ncbi:MAG: aldehyde dehydrogenase family protein [Bacteroidetes bacterium]|nr:MAG: aldehyde dehydrogenase family protein [Bacteroidota bacterium]
MIEKEVSKVFELQKKHTETLRLSTASERIEKLKTLKSTILKNRELIHKAVYADFKKCSAEADLGEIFGVLSSISHAIRHLKKWMRPKSVPTPLPMLFSKGKIYVEPKGTSLIISPWNYPFQLAIDPLVYAIAAGCSAVLKPSELTPNTSAMMKKMLSEIFKENEVSVLEGDANIAQALLKLPFDHIFFTGSPMLGKVIMRAAAENLTSVTLELGGKSPVIVDSDTNIKDTAQKIIWGKFFNCGQTCIAPDYALVHENIAPALIAELKNQIQTLYGNDVSGSEDYPRIVNQRHFLRIKNLLDEAVEKGANIEVGGILKSEENYISPTLITSATNAMQVMHEEIFGPILPIITYKNTKEALNFINEKPKPLALYIFSKSKNFQNEIIKNTSAGGTAINETLAHISNPDLPFGGVNNSGIGKTHGYHGFLAFSNERSVLKQRIGWTTLKMFYPPYTNKKKNLINKISNFT